MKPTTLTPPNETHARIQESITRRRSARLSFGFAPLTALVAAAGCALAGCSVEPGPIPAAPAETSTEHVGTTGEALASAGGSAGTSFLCTNDPTPPSLCICEDVWDCIRLINSGKCGPMAQLECPGDFNNVEYPCTCTVWQEGNPSGAMRPALNAVAPIQAVSQ